MLKNSDSGNVDWWFKKVWGELNTSNTFDTLWFLESPWLLLFILYLCNAIWIIFIYYSSFRSFPNRIPNKFRNCFSLKPIAISVHWCRKLYQVAEIRFGIRNSEFDSENFSLMSAGASCMIHVKNRIYKKTGESYTSYTFLYFIVSWILLVTIYSLPFGAYPAYIRVLLVNIYTWISPIAGDHLYPTFSSHIQRIYAYCCWKFNNCNNIYIIYKDNSNLIKMC
jgi:hypothetical protein